MISTCCSAFPATVAGISLATTELRENAVTIEIGDATVLTASLKDIMRSKEIADRPPDREALPELRELDEEPEIDSER